MIEARPWVEWHCMRADGVVFIVTVPAQSDDEFERQTAKICCDLHMLAEQMFRVPCDGFFNVMN